MISPLMQGHKTMVVLLMNFLYWQMCNTYHTQVYRYGLFTNIGSLKPNKLLQPVHQARMCPTSQQTCSKHKLYTKMQSLKAKEMTDVDLGGDVMTLSRFMIEATRANPDHADLESLVESIQIACKSITNMLTRVGLSIDSDAKTDILYQKASKILQNSLRFTGKLGVLSIENEEQPIIIEESWNSPYIAVFDPLDNSQNADIGMATGTTFAIFKEDRELLTDVDEQLSTETKDKILRSLQPSNNIVAAGYCVYSSATTFVLSLGEGVQGFTLDPYIGEFVLTHPNVQIPLRGQTYSFNEGRAPWWPKGLQCYVQDVKQGLGSSGGTYTARYIGSMVADLHRTLFKGGVFGYPGDSKSAPNGKLRFLHEVVPMAFIIEQAGGKASTGNQRILDRKLVSFQEHIPTFLGSKEDIEEIEKYIKRFS